MKRLILGIYIILSSIVLGQSQTGSVRGNIYEKESGNPVIYCTVQLEGTKFGTTTDLDGFLEVEFMCVIITTKNEVNPSPAK